MNFELLLVKDKGNFWEVIGITYSNAMMVEPDCSTLRATLFAIEECKKALADGKRITLSKTLEYSEVQPKDLIIDEINEFQRYKQMAINEITARMHQAIFAVNVFDLIDYLNCYISLLNAGYYITDSNREDKYFELIEASQECEEPTAISEDAPFEEIQTYMDAKQKYDTAQQNLTLLENYLNCYDRLQMIKSKIKFFEDTRIKIQKANTIEDIDLQLKIYRSNLKNYKMVNVDE